MAEERDDAPRGADESNAFDRVTDGMGESARQADQEAQSRDNTFLGMSDAEVWEDLDEEDPEDLAAHSGSALPEGEETEEQADPDAEPVDASNQPIDGAQDSEAISTPASGAEAIAGLAATANAGEIGAAPDEGQQERAASRPTRQTGGRSGAPDGGSVDSAVDSAADSRPEDAEASFADIASDSITDDDGQARQEDEEPPHGRDFETTLGATTDGGRLQASGDDGIADAFSAAPELSDPSIAAGFDDSPGLTGRSDRDESAAKPPAGGAAPQPQGDPARGSDARSGRNADRRAERAEERAERAAERAADKAERQAEKAEDKAEKAEDKAEKQAEKAEDKDEKAEDKAGKSDDNDDDQRAADQAAGDDVTETRDETTTGSGQGSDASARDDDDRDDDDDDDDNDDDDDDDRDDDDRDERDGAGTSAADDDTSHGAGNGQGNAYGRDKDAKDEAKSEKAADKAEDKAEKAAEKAEDKPATSDDNDDGQRVADQAAAEDAVAAVDDVTDSGEEPTAGSGQGNVASARDDDDRDDDDEDEDEDRDDDDDDDDEDEDRDDDDDDDEDRDDDDDDDDDDDEDDDDRDDDDRDDRDGAGASAADDDTSHGAGNGQGNAYGRDKDAKAEAKAEKAADKAEQKAGTSDDAVVEDGDDADDGDRTGGVTTGSDHVGGTDEPAQSQGNAPAADQENGPSATGSADVANGPGGGQGNGGVGNGNGQGAVNGQGQGVGGNAGSQGPEDAGQAGAQAPGSGQSQGADRTSGEAAAADGGGGTGSSSASTPDDGTAGMAAGNGDGGNNGDDIGITAFADGNDGDSLSGGLGNDNLHGGGGDDEVEGGAGNDTIDAGAGDDEIEGGAGNDVIDGGVGDDEVEGGDGDDVLAGGEGDDDVDGGDGDDTLAGGEGRDKLDGGSGADRLDGGTGDDKVSGGDGDEVVAGGEGDDRLDGGDGDDVLTGGVGTDRLKGGDGTDTLDGGAGDDRLSGGDGDDALAGGAGSDDLKGGKGNDILTGGDGDDRLRGGRGDDVLHGSAGDDRLDGDRGDDVARFDGKFSDYDVREIKDGFEITDTFSSGGTDEVKDVEAFEFADRTLTSDELQAAIDGPGVPRDEIVEVELVSLLPDPHADAQSTIRISGLPEGARLNRGEDNGDRSWSLTAAQLVGLAIAVPTALAVSTPAFAFGVEVLTDRDGDVDAQSAEVTVEFAEGGTASTTIAVGSTEPAGDAALTPEQLAALSPSADKSSSAGDDGASSDSGRGDDGGRKSGSPEIGGGDVALGADAAIDETATVEEDADLEESQVSDSSVADGRGAAAEAGAIQQRTVNANEAPTAIELSSQSVAENSAGAVIGTLTTVDDASGAIAYAVDDDRFEVVDGQLKLKAGQSLDHEAADSVSVGVTATDSGGLSFEQTFTIAVSDSNDAPASISLSASTVAENSAGAVIGTLTTTDADDGDSVSYTVDDNRFEVVDGQLKLKAGQSLDHETADSVDVTVTATDNGGLSRQQVFAVSVGDANEAPTTISLSASSVTENNSGAVIGTLTTSDTDDGDSVSYTVDDNRFEVVGGQLKLKAGQSLDHETADSVDVTVTATDSGGLGVQQVFAVSVVDANEAPTTVSLSASSVAENSSGAVIGTLTTTDTDDGDSVSYTVDDNRFEVVGGQLKLKAGQSLDHESAASVTVNVTATDGGGLTRTEAFAISVSDEAEDPTDLTSGPLDADETWTNGQAVGTVTGSDPDDGDTLSYSLIDDAGGRFAIDSSTGVVSIADASLIDFETATAHNVTVRVTDGTGRTYDETFEISVNDENEVTDTYHQAVTDLNPVGYWRLAEDGPTTAADETGTVSGTYHNTSTGGRSGPFSGITNAATHFSTDDYVTIPDDPAWQLTDGTISLWFNADTVVGVDSIMSRDAAGALEGHFYLDRNGDDLQVRLQGADSGTLTAANVVSADTWHHVSVSFGANGLEIWLDGTMVANDPAITGGVDGNNLPWTIGAWAQNYSGGLPTDPTDFFAGEIAEVSIFDSQLTSTDINTLRDAGVNGTETTILTSGVDNWTGTAAHDIIEGRDGDDVLDGGDGDDLLYGGSDDDTLTGGAGSDVLAGEGGDDIIDGGADDDTISGHDGADTLTGGAGADIIAGGSGNDTASYSGSSSGVSIDLNASTASGGDAAGDTLTGIENLTGSAFADTLTGDGNGNILFGGAGDDALQGLGGDDTLNGGDGSDVFTFGEGDGADTIDGGAAGGWTDSITLENADSSAVGAGWTIDLTSGSVTSSTSSRLVLSEDAAGTITLEDGSTLNFQNIEQVDF